MAFQVGTRLGGYEILAILGAGGMGEVYRARDTKLGREVAIKVLLEEVAGDPERLARFEREARVLASLNHPNVATLFGFHSEPAVLPLPASTGDEVDRTIASGGAPAEPTATPAPAAPRIPFLVMEMVPGDTLADRIQRGPLPVAEAIPIFVQVAEGLADAHDKGVIHRDLKPANLKISKEGSGTPKVKILDFGLAKAMEAADTQRDARLSHSPTLSLAATMRGEILGTAAYMSPEQVQGEPVDRRADVWAYGVCLLEALTGRPVFTGPNVSTVLAAVLRDDPDLDSLPEDAPPALRRLIGRCLARQPQDRLSHIADARLDLREALEQSRTAATAPDRRGNGAVIATRGRRPFLLGLLGGAVLVAAVAAAVALATRGREPAPAPLTYVSTPSPPGTLLAEGPGSALALSRDGRRVAFTVYEGNESRIYVRDLGTREAIALNGSEEARAPFFSPDGNWLAFFARGELRKVAVAGGPPVTVCVAPGSTAGGVWAPNDQIIFGQRGRGLFHVSAAGGEPEPLTTLAPGELDHRWPGLTLDGKTVLYTAWSGDLDTARIVAYSLVDGRTASLCLGAGAKQDPSGHLVFARRDSLWAQVFDPDALAVRGNAIPVSEGVRVMGGGAAHYDVAENGSLIFAPSLAGLSSRLWVVRPDGARAPAPFLPELTWFTSVDLSADGSRLAVGHGDPGAPELWIYDLRRGSGSRIATPAYSGIWDPDGTRLAFSRSQGDDQENIWSTPSTNTLEAAPLLEQPHQQIPTAWSSDGAWILFQQDSPVTGLDVMALSLDETRVVPIVATEANERHGRFSPDGRWIAYCSDASGRDEIYVTKWPEPTTRSDVSIEGGRFPVWSADGRTLYYSGPVGIMAVSVETGTEFRVGSPRLLFEANTLLGVGGYVPSVFAVSPDGSTFYVAIRNDDASGGDAVLVQNWGAEIERLAARSR